MYKLDQVHAEIAIQLGTLVSLVQTPLTIENLYAHVSPSFFSEQFAVTSETLQTIVSNISPIFRFMDDSTIVPWHRPSFGDFITSRPIGERLAVGV